MFAESHNRINFPPRKRRGPASRDGIVAVEAALCLPVLLILMFGVWEVGRIVQVTQIMTNAAREGARVAAGGYANTISGGGTVSTPVTVAYVQTTVKNYLTAAGLPTAAVTNAQIQVINQSANSWTNPVDALPNDKFRVTLTIPSGTAFNSLRWSLITSITNTTQLSVSVNWSSANDTLISVDTALPY